MPQPSDPAVGAVVLAGGTSRRWGGVDKTAVPLAGVPLLAHAVRSVLPHVGAVAVVAPADHPARALVGADAAAAGATLAWTREDPPGGGPLAGLAAGLAALAGSPSAVLVVAGDLPFAGPACARLLAAVAAGAQAAVGVDAAGRRQPLLAAYAAGPARAVLAGTDVADRPLRVLLDALDVVEVPVGEAEALDLDTPAEAERAERLLAGRPQGPA